MTVVLNPFQWNANIKTLLGVLSICGSTLGGANYIGGKIYEFAKVQTAMIEHIKTAERGLVDLKIDLATTSAKQDTARDSSISGLKNSIEPRIQRLEEQTNAAAIDASAARQQVVDMQRTLDRVENLGKEHLAVSQSHTPDIRATAKALALPGKP